VSLAASPWCSQLAAPNVVRTQHHDVKLCTEILHKWSDSMPRCSSLLPCELRMCPAEIVGSSLTGVMTRLIGLQPTHQAMQLTAPHTHRCWTDATRRLLLLLPVTLAACCPAALQQRQSRLVWPALLQQLRPAAAATQHLLGAATNQHRFRVLRDSSGGGSVDPMRRLLATKSSSCPPSPVGLRDR